METSKLLNRVRDVIRAKNFSHSTEKCYVNWIYRFIIFHDKKYPLELGAREIEEFLTDLAFKRKASASTQNQAMSAIIFLYKNVLEVDLPDFDFKPSREERHLPVVFSRDEVKKVLENLQGESYLMASLLYGSGLRLTECIKLRVRDINFGMNEIMVRNETEDYDHKTILPHLLKQPLRRQIKKANLKLEENLLIKEFDGVSLTEELKRKYPNASKKLTWQYIFASKRLSTNHNGILKQNYVHESFLQKAVKNAINDAEITKKASCQTLRHSFAVHLLEDGYDIKTVQKLLGHKNTRTTMKYNHVLKRNKLNVKSPIDI